MPRLKKALRVLAAGFAGCLLLFAITIGSAYFFFQGKTGEGSVIASRIESGIQEVIGPDFKVKLQYADLSFGYLGKAVFKSGDIVITRKSDGGLLSNIGKLQVSVNLLQTLTGDISFDSIKIEDAKLDAGMLGSGKSVFLPPHLRAPLDIMGLELARFQKNLENQNFQKFEIRNSVITGPVLGRKQTDPVRLTSLKIQPAESGAFDLDAMLGTAESGIEINSRYVSGAAEGSRYEFSASGINLREWLESPFSQLAMVASDSIVRVNGVIPFDTQNRALDPEVAVKTDNGNFRMGWYSSSEVYEATLNFRLILDNNQIELDPSEVSIGKLKARFIGGIKPLVEEQGYAGALRYDMIMQRGEFEPTFEGEPVVPAAFKMAGIYDGAAHELSIDNIFLTTKKGSIQGSGKLGLGDSSPSLVASAETKGISVIALKQFWPFFIAEGARGWIHDHVIDGWVESGTMQANIPAGILFRLYVDRKLAPEHLSTELNLKDFSFIPFGELPPITRGAGVVKLEGMKVSGVLKEGIGKGANDKTVNIRSGSFVMEDFAAEERVGETTLKLDGDIQALAEIADRRPLRVMERMKVTPSQFAGKGHADIVARFPIGRKPKYEEVEWNVLLDIENGSSTKKLANRKIMSADVLIDANPNAANVSGTANIDGVESRISLVEPVGKSGSVKRSRQISSVLGEAERKKLGFDLHPVIKGPITVKVTQTQDVEQYELGFRDAEVSLPWIGWSKGKGIPATGGFVLKKRGGEFRLNEFRLSGPGFEGAGTMVLDKKGLVSADLTTLKLNETDSIALKIDRKKDAYNIRASGASYDARGIMNTLIFESSFKEAQGNRSVNLTASVDEVRGFEGRIIRNANIVYESRNGKLTKLDLNGETGTYLVQAQRNADQTLFTISSSNAGNALAFTNIYTKMQGGQLVASLVRDDEGPFTGPVRATNFTVVNEPKLGNLVSSVRREAMQERGERRQIVSENADKRAVFVLAEGRLIKGDRFLQVKDGVIRSQTMGFTLEGEIFNERDRMNVFGTFMPANAVNLAVSAIPLLKELFSNGRNSALIGITYQLKGPRENPELRVNPLSIVTPGIFNKVFEYN